MSVQKIYDAILELDDDEVVTAVQEAIDDEVDTSVILNEGLIGAMDEVGRLFSAGTLFVPEMLMAANVMKIGLDMIKPLLKGDNSGRGIVIIGTVAGDRHDIGKNLVSMMMEGAGFEVIDLGIDVPAEKFIDAAKEKSANLICLSALLTTTMAAMGETVSAIKSSGLPVKTMVGGAPVGQDFANDIGADGYAPDAGEAVMLGRNLMAS
ncbi:B12-binding domain-containing protein [Acetobacterium sp. KB-1]|jgi:5-methyltetrahydrofolate--homocysteine methyltransferase|uniref:cobalamin B12-binding domain-containing protein n=1 Tax=Acetobacterium sp. KB-1 TaxID=2184575 RepID=UPI000DBEB9FA|nr:corrinoid protein [Acetobacterium sp. KB-1]AWW26656.1 cobalamin-binding protein [Acetobacterium sp. KB-1]